MEQTGGSAVLPPLLHSEAPQQPPQEQHPGDGEMADASTSDVETLESGTIDTAVAPDPAALRLPPLPAAAPADPDAMTDSAPAAAAPVPATLGGVVLLAPAEHADPEPKQETAMDVEPEAQPEAQPEPRAEAGAEERAAFLARLHAFMAARGTPIEHIPVIDHRELDLWQLHRSVARLGGLAAVVENKLWRTVAADLGVDQDRTDAGYRLRMHYEKHLLPFEQQQQQQQPATSTTASAASAAPVPAPPAPDAAPPDVPARAAPRVSARTLRRQMDAASMPSPELVPLSPTTLAMSPPALLLPPPAPSSSSSSAASAASAASGRSTASGSSKRGTASSSSSSSSSRTSRRSDPAESARAQQQQQQQKKEKEQQDEDDEDEDEEDEDDDGEEEEDEQDSGPRVPVQRPTHGQGSALEAYSDGVRWHQQLVAAMGRGAADRLRCHFALAVPLPPLPDPAEQAALLFGASEVDECRALYAFFSALRRHGPGPASTSSSSPGSSSARVRSAALRSKRAGKAARRRPVALPH